MRVADEQWTHHGARLRLHTPQTLRTASAPNLASRNEADVSRQAGVRSAGQAGRIQCHGGSWGDASSSRPCASRQGCRAHVVVGWLGQGWGWGGSAGALMRAPALPYEALTARSHFPRMCGVGRPRVMPRRSQHVKLRFDAFWGLAFDASLGFPGEGPVKKGGRNPPVEKMGRREQIPPLKSHPPPRAQKRMSTKIHGSVPPPLSP